MNQKEELFFDKLKNIFIGAKIEGDSGFINLMRIKSSYFDIIFKELDKKIDEDTKAFPEFKEEMFDKLYTFFKIYFSDSGSIYFSYTPLKSKVYEKVYSNNEDVMLFWKTHMLYYVKTDKLWNNLIVDLEEEDFKYKVSFEVSNLQHKKGNEKKEIIYELKNIKEKEITFNILHSERGKKTKLEDILKEFKKEKIHLDEERLIKLFKIFEKQNEVDYFINKDAESFLKEQFDLWLKNYKFDDESDFSEKRLKQLKVLKEIAYKVIDFVAQFEDELVKIWNKPKFVLNSDYVISLNRIKDVKIIEKIIANKGFEEQIKEWKDLGILKTFVKEKLWTKEGELTNEYSNLPIDTKYFNEDIKLEILSLFEDLDNQLYGWLIHSENYQALKTILPKFKGKVQTCYIDPPYNAKYSEIIYLNKYKDSSWLTLMENRISLAQSFLKNEGVFECAVDENEQESLGLLLSNLFPEYKKTCVAIVHNPRGIQGNQFSYTNEFTYFLLPPKFKLNKRILEKSKSKPFMKTGNESERNTAKNCFYPVFVKDNIVIGAGEVSDEGFHPITSQILKKDEIWELYPIDSDGGERKWRYARNSFEDIKEYLKVIIPKSGKMSIELEKDKESYRTVWIDKKYNAAEYGSNLLKNMGLKFDYAKSLYNVYDCLYSAVKGNKELIMDFFAGSGTTGQAIIEINRRNNTNHKFLLVEMGEHFYTTLLPRIKKLTYSSEPSNWKKGIAKPGEGISLFFKYYDLEQYEQTLKKTVYKDSDPFVDFKNESIYNQYVFMKDLKLLDAMKIDYENNKIHIDYPKIYLNIDLAETISNLKGKYIKKIEKNAVILEENEKVDFDKIDFNLVKPLIWW